MEHLSLAETQGLRLGFGAMHLTGEGIWGPSANKQEAIAVLRRAHELGINLIDTADSYGPEVSELLIAEALCPYPKGLVIATLAWRLQRSSTMLPIPGTSSVKHLEENVLSTTIKLTQEEFDTLDQIGKQ